MEHSFIGFDVREMWLPAWPPQRKEQFCLRLDMKKVLSADSLVWPSVFDLHPVLARPAQHGFVHQHLWDDLESMLRSALPYNADPDKPSWTIGVGFFGDLRGLDELPAWAPMLGAANPSSPGVDWVFLGYDVCDDYLLSGLSNCGYVGEPDASYLRQQWATFLNEYHLFAELHRAQDFKELTDRRVPEHAPFFVYSLWRKTQENRDWAKPGTATSFGESKRGRG